MVPLYAMLDKRGRLVSDGKHPRVYRSLKMANRWLERFRQERWNTEYYEGVSVVRLRGEQINEGDSVGRCN